MKKQIVISMGVGAFISFFCWGFPALNGAEVNWLHAALAFVGFSVTGILVSYLGSGALNRLFETGGRITTSEEETKQKP